MEILPFEINYDITIMSETLEQKLLNTWNCISYNDHYINNASNIINSRFSNNYDHIPGFDIIISNMIEKMQNTTPLEEWEQRNFINNAK